MEKLTEIRRYLRTALSHKRYIHSLGVEQTSIRLAGISGIDQSACALAGLSHDICREMPVNELLTYVDEDLKLTEMIKINNPILLHGSAGAKFLKNKFQINDFSVLNAVKYHTSGYKELDNIGKVVFAADYLEPNTKGV